MLPNVAAAVIELLVIVTNLHNGDCMPSDGQIMPKIVGGFSANIENYPFMVNLYRSNNFACGGSLLTSSCVLTAAHCVDGFLPDYMQVYAGATRVKSGQMRHVDYQIVHSGYNNRDMDMDVAILKLDRPFEPHENISTVQMDYKPLRGGEKIHIPGWGWDGKRLTKDLKAFNLTVWSHRQCPRSFRLSENMFCAFEAGSDTCFGDSGGPVILNGKEVGIVSWGVDCAKETPGVYVRLSSRKVSYFVRSIQMLYCSN